MCGQSRILQQVCPSQGCAGGFIGAVRNYVINELPAAGTTIHTKVDILQDIFGMTLANARVVSGDKVYATAEIKLSVRNVE